MVTNLRFLLIIFLFFTGFSVNGQTPIRPYVISGAYVYQNFYTYKHKILAPLCYGVGLNIWEYRNAVNLYFACVFNQSTIEYPLPTYSYYRRELTNLTYIGVKWNILPKKKYNPYIHLNTGRVGARINLSSSDKAVTQGLPEKFSRVSDPYLGIGVGYTVVLGKWKLEPLIQYSITKPNSYPFFLNKIAMLQLGYTINSN